MIDHNVMRFDVSVHDAFAVTEVQRFQQLIDVESDVVIHESGIQRPKIGVVDVLEDQTRCLALTVSDHI
jgi:hypothetical protein